MSVVGSFFNTVVYGGIVSGFSLLVASSHTNIALAQLAPQEISAIAKPISVRIDGTNEGSGVIIDRSGNTYTVITNWHVVEENGQYIVQTHDGQKHSIQPSQIQKLADNIDLALIKFASNNQYEIARLGESEKLGEGQTIYLAGYPGNEQIIGESDRFYRFNSLNINAILPSSRQGGYSLAYGGENFNGMSGSPILNGDGDLVGINGIAYQDADGKARSNYAIPIDIYTKLLNSSPDAVESNFGYGLQFTIDNNSWVNAIAINDNQIISGSNDRAIKIWNLETGELEKTLTGHTDEVLTLAINQDKIVSGSKDKTVKVWNLETGELEQTLTGHTDEVWAVTVKGDKIVSGSQDKTIKVWNLETGELEQTLTGHTSGINSIAIANNKIISGSDDRTIKIWNLDTEKPEKTLMGHTDEVWTVAVEGEKIVSGSKDNTVRVWNLNTGVLEKTFTGHSGWIYAVDIDGDKIVSSSLDETVKVWNLNTGILEQTLDRHSAEIWTVAIDNGKIVSAGKDEQIKVWQLQE